MSKAPKNTQNPNPSSTSNISGQKNSMVDSSASENIAQKFKIKSWYSNRYQIVVVQRNILMLLTVFLTISMTASIIFVKYVMSSKSLEPYVIEIEEKSGVPTIVNQMTTQNLTGDESVKRYFINQFIQAAAGYDPKTYRLDAEKVRLMATQNIYADFRSRINPRELGVDSKIDLRIKSIKFLDPVTVQIRILRTTSSKERGVSQKDEVITMSFYFANLTLNAEERLINPLGFQVTSFSIVEEIFNY